MRACGSRWLILSLTLSLLAVAGRSAASGARDGGPRAQALGAPDREAPTSLPFPADGGIPVAFVLGEGAQVTDFAGPWGVFESARLADGGASPFKPYVVAERTQPLKASSGLTIVPDFTFEDAPPPRLVVVPAMKGDSPVMRAWLAKTALLTDLTMSVCDGALVLAKARLLDGRPATAHHDVYDYFEAVYPNVQVKRGVRYVDAGRIATSGGLTSGTDLALHVVERYLGRAAAERTAYDMEYQGTGWKNPDSNAIYAKEVAADPGAEIDPVCRMAVDATSSFHASYRGRTYRFCSQDCERAFEADPGRFVSRAQPRAGSSR